MPTIDTREARRKEPEVATKVLIQLPAGGLCRSSRLYVGERLGCLPVCSFVLAKTCGGFSTRARASWLPLGGRGIVGLEFGGFALEDGVEGHELRDGFLGQGEVMRVNLDADRLVGRDA